MIIIYNIKKIKLIIIAILLGVGIFSVVKTYLNQRQCQDIILGLEWNGGDSIYPSQIPRTFWDEEGPIELIVTVETLRSGELSVTIDSQESREVYFSRTREGPYTSGSIEIASANPREALNPIKNSVWIKSRETTDIYVKAILGENCKRREKAFLIIPHLMSTMTHQYVSIQPTSIPGVIIKSPKQERIISHLDTPKLIIVVSMVLIVLIIAVILAFIIYKNLLRR